jgi:hypothetical protein
MPQMAFYCHHEHQNKKWALSLGQNWRTENRKPGARGVRCAVLPQQQWRDRFLAVKQSESGVSKPCSFEPHGRRISGSKIQSLALPACADIFELPDARCREGE